MTHVQGPERVFIPIAESHEQSFVRLRLRSNLGRLHQRAIENVMDDGDLHDDSVHLDIIGCRNAPTGVNRFWVCA